MNSQAIRFDSCRAFSKLKALASAIFPQNFCHKAADLEDGFGYWWVSANGFSFFHNEGLASLAAGDGRFFVGVNMSVGVMIPKKLPEVGFKHTRN